MRYILLFLIIATVVMVFVFADQFPRFLAHYPMLQEANWTVREWMGMDTPRPSRLSDRKLQETDRILREQSSKKRGPTKLDLSEYHE
jgi:hypothetical protein